jgi:hypothetical protein
MPTALERQLGRLGRQREQLLERLAAMSEPQLAFEPGVGHWSIAGVVEHLVLVEEAMVRNGRRQPGARPAWVGLRSRLLGQIVLRALGTDMRIRTPTAAVVPSSQVPLADLAPRWAVARADLEAYLGELPPPRAWRTAFYHPRTGWITPMNGLRFFEVHCAHHVRQIERIASADGFPGRHS